MPLTIRCALVALLMGAACTGDDAPEDLGPPSALIGTGIDEFEDLEGGDDIFITQGPQGGFHFFGSVRVQGLEPGDPESLGSASNPTTEFRIYVDEIRVDVDAARFTQGLDEVAGAAGHEMVGRLVILDIDDDSELDGSEVVFEVEVMDVRGVSATDARTLTAIPHPANN